MQEGCELCPGGGATSSGECCLAQWVLTQQEKKKKKTFPKGEVAPAANLALHTRGGKRSVGAGQVCTLYSGTGWEKEGLPL